MTNRDDNDMRYRNWCDIMSNHGLIVAAFYSVLRLSEIMPTRLWVRLGEQFDCFCISINNRKIKKTTAWWQDIGVLIHALATILIYWEYTSNVLAWILIADILTYNSRVLWFDDLIPDKPRSVLSHRRLLFQSLINFTETIFLFAVIYFNYCGQSFCQSQIAQASFEVATTLSRSDILISCPTWLLNLHIAVSIFFLVVVISIIASVGYKREELAK